MNYENIDRFLLRFFESIQLFLYIILALIVIVFVYIIFSLIKRIINIYSPYKKLSIPNDFMQMVNNLNYNIQDLQNKKAKAKKFEICEISLLFVAVIGLIIGVVSRLFIINKNISDISSIIAIISILLYFIIVFVGKKAKSEYKASYVKQLITNVLDLVDTDLKYSVKNAENYDIGSNVRTYINTTNTIVTHSFLPNDQAESENDYTSSKLDLRRYNKFVSDEFINIEFNGMDIKSRNIRTEVIYRSLLTRSNHFRTLFSGLFVTVNGNNTFNNDYSKISTYNITSDSSGVRKFVVHDINRDKKINSSFFSDEINRYLLHFYDTYGIDYDVSFENDKIYFRFFTQYKLEPNSLNKIDDTQLLYSYFVIFKFIIGFTKKYFNS